MTRASQEMGGDKNNSVMENGHVSSDPMIVGNRKSAMMSMANSACGFMCEVAVSYIVPERNKEGYGNGDAYAGEYFADKMHGYGVYSFANGHCYEGSWHDGKRQGLGMYTFRNGETQSGHWQNGVLDIPSTQSATYPVSPVGVNHSRVLNAVQEARRAAEKAYDVAKVDERVNRAVASANRAANAARVASVKAVQNQMHHNVNSNSIPISIV